MGSTARAATISPALQEIEAARAEVVERVVRVINTEEVPQTYYAGVLAFKASDETSSPEFLPPSKDQTGLVQWISFASPQIQVPARSFVDVPFSIHVPSDVESGSYYAAVTISNAPSDIVASNGAIVEAKTASLILLTVTGETNRQLGLLDFTSSIFAARSTTLAGTYQYRVQNQGNVHVSPKGTIRFSDVFGRTLLEVDANPLQSRVLPGTTRTYSVEVDASKALLALGPVRAQLKLTYDDTKVLQQEEELWLVSWPIISGVSVLVLSVLAFVLLKKRT